MAGQRIGLIVPSSNTVMEPDLHRSLPASVVISTTRIFLEEVTREAELRMIHQDLPHALRLIKTTEPQMVVFGCTSAGSLGGLTHDDAIARMIERETGSQALTVLGALLPQLRSIHPRRIAVFTPYIDDLTDAVARSLAETGFSIAKAAGMGIRDNLKIGVTTPGEIASFVESCMLNVSADCVFLSCTNWQALDAIPPLQQRLNLPVLSSNQSVVNALRIAIPGVASQDVSH
jgi:maleate isomerase